MEGAGLMEAITYSLTTDERADMLVSPELAEVAKSAVRLAKPMTADHSTLRQSLLPELLHDLSYNVARKQQNLGYYEIGDVFISKEEIRSEEHTSELQS